MQYSRFFLADLHVHTVADPQQRYGDFGSREPNEQFAKALIEAYAAAGVQVVAVTDHNRVDWYPMLHRIGEERGVFVFPGIEFSVNGCHLLAIWDLTDEGWELARRFCMSLFGPGERPFGDNGDPRVVTRGQVLELAQQARDHKGLVLAPHSTAARMGLFGNGVVRNSAEVAQSGLVAGFDVVGNAQADVLRNPRSEFADAQPSWILSGDTRAFEGIGQRATHLKLGHKPTLEGTRQALLLPPTRVRLPSSAQDTWGHVQGARFAERTERQWSRLTTLRIDGGFHDGLDIHFAPGLNAIIGGKGTGKSTLVEILRYVLGLPEALDRESVGNRTANFRANAEAKVGYVAASGDSYEVGRAGDNTPSRLYRAGRETEVEVGRRVNVRLFGQRELRALSDNPQALLDFVASQAGQPWRDVMAEERVALDALRSHDDELDSLERDIERMADDEAELVDLRDRLAIAEERGAAELLHASGDLGAADAALQRVFDWAGAVREKVEELAQLQEPPSPAHTLVPEGTGALNRDLAVEITANTTSLRQVIIDTVQRGDAVREVWNAARDSERRRIAQRLAEAGIGNPEELERLQARSRALSEAVASLPQRRTRHVELLRDRQFTLRTLSDVRRRKSRLVEESARTLTQAVGPRVRVSTDPMGNREHLLSVLEDALRGQQVRREQLDRLCRSAPSALADAIRDGPEAVEGLGCSSATAAKIVALSPPVVRACEEADTPDQIVVEIDLGNEGAEAWSAVTEVSPGQRATALLALALAGGSEPLVIDQPEDDLDNRYIYDEVVRVLRRVCESRQVIVVTHNANIPILGDAELILALDAMADRGRVLAYGGLEDPNVAEQARRILEGGEEAFQARQQRYSAARK